VGEAGPATEAGQTGVDTPGLVVNSSGGLVGRGHPLGATGLAQVVELVTQMRGRAGERQVEGARLGVAVNTGGIIDGDAGFVGIHAIRAGASA
jgi:acetyl-CoA acetyltransferase